MAYGKKYFAKIQDEVGNIFHTNLLKNGYTGSSTQITDYSTSPLYLMYRGGRDEVDNAIHGSEMQFSFYSKEGENYDDLLTSNYKDWQLEVVKEFESVNTTESLSNAEYESNINNWDVAANGGSSGNWGWSSFAGGSAVNYQGTFATQIPYAPNSFFFHTTMEGWYNFTGGLSPQWAWSSNYAGSVSVVTPNNLVPPNLRKDDIDLPQSAFTITIGYVGPASPSSANLKMSFLIRDSSNNQLVNTQFTDTGIFTGSEQFANITITASTVWTNADHMLIVVGSTDFNTGDTLYITFVQTSYAGTITFDRSYYLRQSSISLDAAREYYFRWGATFTGGTNTHTKLYCQFYNNSLSPIGSQMLLASGGTVHSGSTLIDQSLVPNIYRIQLWTENTVDSGDRTHYLRYVSIKPKTDTITYWKGWVKPDQITRRFLAPSYYMNLSATDGLQDLSNIDFPSTNITGHTSLIKLVKTCLSQTGIDLNIEAQLNIKEHNLMVSGDTLFKKVTANSKRFVKNQSGRNKYTNCYEAISEMLNPFNCQLIQSNGKYVITNKNEINSKKHLYNYTSLTSTTSNYNRLVDVTSNYVMADSDELSKVAPNKKFQLTFRNKNLGDTVISNGGFDTDLTGWSNATGTSAFETFEWLGGRLHTRVPSAGGGSGDPDIMHYFSSANFTATAGSGATFNFSVDIDLSEIGYQSPHHANPFLKFKLKYPDNSIVEDDYFGQRLSDGLKTYTNRLPFPLNQTGTYKLTIEIIPDTDNEDYDYYRIYFDNVIGVQKYLSDTTFDKFYEGTVTGSTAILSDDEEVFFGDVLQTSDAGALKVGTGLTTTWNNYGENNQYSLHKLLTYNKLKLSSAFKNYLRLNLKHDNTISFSNALQINSKKYQIAGYSNDVKNCKLELDLVEILESAIGITFNQVTLTSVDGQD